jgi:hypothetical protein
MALDREWVTVRDPDHRHRQYTFDVSFLLSDYTCIYGAGCQGIRTDRRDETIGCCLHGAYLNEDDDPDALEQLVHDDLDAEVMEHHDDAVANGVLETDDEGETRTRTHGDACIFLNGPDFPGGMGCALHHLAESRGEHHMTYKPTVCWQVPLHRTVDERTGNDGQPFEDHRIEAFERGHWGTGGADFTWWCTERSEAFVGDRPVYRSMEHELRAMVGDAVYDELADFLDRRRRQRGRVRFLPVF